MLFIGNLKSYLSEIGQVDTLAKALNRLVKQSKHEIVLAPSFPHLGYLAAKKHDFALAAQDISLYEEGAHTGEVTGESLRSLGVSYVLVGHSERRNMGESNEVISQKVSRALDSGLKVIFAIGEEERDSHGNYLSFITEQLLSVLGKRDPAILKNIILAYEPVWAIGKDADEVITAHDLEEMILFIRKIIAERIDEKYASKVKIIYGGSVSADNVEGLIIPHIHGFLPGRASSTPETFSALIKAVT